MIRYKKISEDFYVKHCCNGENCKINIARVALSVKLGVCLFVDR